MKIISELQIILDRSLYNNGTVDVESLCIIPGELVFAVYCYVSVIDNNGNVGDAAVLAATASLCHFRRPDYTIEGKQVKIYTPEEKEPVPISLHFQPICITFCILDNDLILLDPPYSSDLLDKALSIINSVDILSDGGIIICEARKEKELPEMTEPYRKIKEYRYGHVKICTYTKEHL